MAISKVQAHCIKIAVKTGNIELAVKLALMANVQHDSLNVIVYEARNDAVGCGITAHQFAGGLAALTAKGFYFPHEDPEYKGKWGRIANLKTEEEK